MCIACKISTANLRLIDNLIVSPDISKVYGEPCWLTDCTAELGSFWIDAAIDCLRAISDGMISVKCRLSNFNSYTQI